MGGGQLRLIRAKLGEYMAAMTRGRPGKLDTKGQTRGISAMVRSGVLYLKMIASVVWSLHRWMSRICRIL